jgi:hypothetical protein
MNLPIEVHQTLCRDLHADDLYEFRTPEEI